MVVDIEEVVFDDVVVVEEDEVSLEVSSLAESVAEDELVELSADVVSFCDEVEPDSDYVSLDDAVPFVADPDSVEPADPSVVPAAPSVEPEDPSTVPAAPSLDPVDSVSATSALLKLIRISCSYLFGVTNF